MKRIVMYCAVFVLALMILPACSLATTAESPIILGGTGDDSCYSNLPLPNGNLILSMASAGGRNGEPEYGNHVLKVWLVCLAPDGSVVWENSFGADRKGNYTTLHFLSLNEDDTFSGMIRYEIGQRAQYRQKMTFSCADGSLLYEGEKVPDTVEEDSIYRQYFANDGQMIVSETLMSEMADKPRIIRLYNAEGSELWTLDATNAGISLLEGWVSTPQGAVLYGRNRSTINQESTPTALLVDSSGHVVWTYQPDDLKDGGLFNGILDSEGHFVAVGFCNYNGEQNSSKQLLVCLDSATGAVLWQRTADMAQCRLPGNKLMEINGGYMICASDSNASGILLETIDTSGNKLQVWTESMPDYRMFSPRFLLWNGELWTESLLDGSHMDVVLQRVALPDNL